MSWAIAYSAARGWHFLDVDDALDAALQACDDEGRDDQAAESARELAAALARIDQLEHQVREQAEALRFARAAKSRLRTRVHGRRSVA